MPKLTSQGDAASAARTRSATPPRPRFETPDGVQENIARIARLFPGVVTEARDATGQLRRTIHFERLKEALGEAASEPREAYDFTWVGKKAAALEAGKPIRKTLRPCPAESKNWDTTGNLYIEGDNLEVLKLLQESYLGKVKMIYIDPPYNTGNDFIYRDNFASKKEDYEAELGIEDEETGEHLFRNTETNGRFHSDWCSMIYSRLLIARSLLREDGAIFISIDDGEVAQLRKICDEVFGEDNFVAQMIWAAGRKNDSRLISNSHEYIICYVKDALELKTRDVIWRQKKKGIEDIYKQHDKIRKIHGDDYASMTIELKKWFKDLPDSHPAKAHKHYCHVDRRGIYFPDNISWPGGGGPKYEVLHPKTKKPVKVPSGGWRFSKPETIHEWIKEDRIHFGEDETSVPCRKSYLKEHETQTPYSVFYQDGRAATKRLAELLKSNSFDFPKDEEIIQDIVSMLSESGDIIFDFFSGSATTAHAVMQLNAEDAGKRKFIMVQLPESTPEDSEAAKAGFKNICDIGKERIRRAGEKIVAELKKNKKADGASLFEGQESGEVPMPDIGFRVFKVDSSNVEDIYYNPDAIAQDLLEGVTSHIKPDRSSADLLFGCLLDWGLPLSLPCRSEQLAGVTVHTYNDGDLVACFDPAIPEKAVFTIAQRAPLRAVFCDACFADSAAKINVFEIFKTISPGTEVKVI